MRGTFETNIPNDLTMVFGIFFYYLLNFALPRISIYPKFASLPKVSIYNSIVRLSHGSASLPKIPISQYHNSIFIKIAMLDSHMGLPLYPRSQYHNSIFIKIVK